LKLKSSDIVSINRSSSELMTNITPSFTSITPRKIRVIGVPLDLGQSRRGVDMGPSAVRVAGLEARRKRAIPTQNI
jgi:arginase family enzyme